MIRLVSVAALFLLVTPALPAPPTTAPSAVESARASLSKAAFEAQAAWEATAEYKSLKADLDAKKSVLESARAGTDAKAKLDASAAYNDARLKLEKAESAKVANDARVVAAIAALKEAIADAAREETSRAAARQALIPKSTFYTRANAAREGQAELDRAAAVDAKILNYLEKNKVLPAIAAAIWEGRPMVGMTEAEVQLIGWIDVTGQTGDRKFGTMHFVQKDAMGRQFCRVSIEGGKIVQFSY